ncbi:hypothetical protein Nmel_000306, partial [Mimus melanotis]
GHTACCCRGSKSGFLLALTVEAKGGNSAGGCKEEQPSSTRGRKDSRKEGFQEGKKDSRKDSRKEGFQEGRKDSRKEGRKEGEQ